MDLYGRGMVRLGFMEAPDVTRKSAAAWRVVLALHEYQRVSLIDVCAAPSRCPKRFMMLSWRLGGRLDCRET